MNFIRGFNLKKTIIFSCLIIILFLIINIFITKYSYKEYYSKSNEFISYTIDKVKSEYPNVDINNLIQKLNEEIPENVDKTLYKYGIDIEKMPAILTYETIYQRNLLITSGMIIILYIFLLIIYLMDSYHKNKEIRLIIKTIQDINQGNYNLKLNNRVEGDLSILNDEVYKTTIMLQEKAEKSLKSKEELKDSIANISHQIKTPLTSILIMVDNLIEEEINPKLQKEFLIDIRNQIEKMNFLIVALLKLSRFDANVIEFKKDIINIKQLLFSVSKNVDVLANSKDISLHIIGNNSDSFIGDYEWEKEALTNIVKNCIEHTEEHKNIYINYVENHFYAKLEIVDEGIGMDKDEVKRIFERFYKGKNSNSNSIGIGLALAKEIIEKDNGSIKVTSILKKGTKFTIKYFK